jgi:hypothetical protein
VAEKKLPAAANAATLELRVAAPPGRPSGHADLVMEDLAAVLHLPVLTDTVYLPDDSIPPPALTAAPASPTRVVAPWERRRKGVRKA